MNGEMKFGACGRCGEVELVFYFHNAVDVELSEEVRC